MPAWHDVWTRKLLVHSALNGADLAALRALPNIDRKLHPGEDLVRQGDRPHSSAVVRDGMLGRYHTLRTGRRQYLSLHIAGDLPDAQSLFIETMDHGVCAIDEALVSTIPHAAILTLFRDRPSVGVAIWRETLIDAAIFRQAITNNGARGLVARLSHLFCEQYYRARAAGLAKPGACRFPLTQTQISEMLGTSLPSISRALQVLRRTKAMELRGSQLFIHDWDGMVELADFNPSYLQLRKPARL